jgi:hypothetical protein
MPRIPDNCRLLHGPYHAPTFGLGKLLRCRIRGRVMVKRINAGPIPWPQTIVGCVRAFIQCGDLVRAVCRESEVAVAYWWGVTPQTVWVCRNALGVGATTEGTSRLRSKYFSQPWAQDAREKGWAKARDPERREKIAARRGMPRPRHVIGAMNKAWRGKTHTEESRRKMSESNKRRGAWPPAAGRPWEPWEDELLRTLPRNEAARRTGRPLASVTGRPRTLDLPDGRKRENRKA